MKKINKFQTLVGIFLAAASLQVSAIPSMTGEVGMFGNFIAVDSTWTATGTAAATGVDFEPNMFLVSTETESFAGVSAFQPGFIKDFQFDPGLALPTNPGVPSGPNIPVASIVDFWEIGGFSFELTSAARGFTNDPDTFLVLEGAGIIRHADYLDTLGTWIFTGDTTGSFASGQGTLTWSAGTTAVVPEPGILVLLGIGLVGIFAGRKLAK